LIDRLPRPKALLIDLDGTLLDERYRVSARSVEAVREAARLMPVAIATGRVFEETCHYARLLGLSAPQVSDNGARLVDPVAGTTIHDLPMNAGSARLLVATLESEGVRFFASDNGRTVRRSADFKAWRVTVVTAYMAGERQAMELAAMDRGAEEVVAIASHGAEGRWYINYSHRDGGKGYGARMFASHLGIDPDDVMAIGDGANDVELFDAVGIPVAMGHASSGIKARATYVTESQLEEGVACAIERFVLDRTL